MAENDENRYISISQMVAKENIETEKYRVMPRQEAIECMARAMFEWQRPGSKGDVPIEDVWQNEKCGFENLAKTALDALLSL